MRPSFVVYQSKRDYDRERAENFFTFWRIAGWVVMSGITAILLYDFSKKLATYVFWGCLLTFAISDLTRDPKIRAYANLALVLPFSATGIFALLMAIYILFIQKTDTEMALFSLGLSGFLFYRVYRRIKENTTFF